MPVPLRSPLRRPRRSLLGFSLIEIMVGLVIGMLSVIVIMKLFAASEADKRTTVGGNTAEVGGIMALYTLERDVRRAGYGLTSYKLIGCNLTYTTATDTASVTFGALAPVTINPATSVIPAGDTGTDTLLVSFGNSNSTPEGDALITTSTAGSYTVSTLSSFRVDDYLVAQAPTRPSTCSLTRDKVTSVVGPALGVTPGVSGLTVNSIVYNLGPAPSIRAYAIRKGNLTVCDYTAYNCGSSTYTSTLNSDVWVPVASNVVGMRAEYGRDTTAGTMAGVVLTYDQTTPGTVADGFAVYCSWNRALAVRVALVARNAQYDKAELTTTAPTWSGSTTVTTGSPTNPTAVTIDLSGNTDWKHYRYKTIETTIPLRNLVWQGSQTAYQGGGEC